MTKEYNLEGKTPHSNEKYQWNEQFTLVLSDFIPSKRTVLLILILKRETEDSVGQNLWCDIISFFSTFDKQGHKGYLDDSSSKPFYNLLIFLAH